MRIDLNIADLDDKIKNAKELFALVKTEAEETRECANVLMSLLARTIKKTRVAILQEHKILHKMRSSLKRNRKERMSARLSCFGLLCKLIATYIIYAILQFCRLLVQIVNWLVRFVWGMFSFIINGISRAMMELKRIIVPLGGKIQKLFQFRNAKKK